MNSEVLKKELKRRNEEQKLIWDLKSQAETLRAENAALRARIAELEADRDGAVNAYVQLQDKLIELERRDADRGRTPQAHDDDEPVAGTA